MSTFSIHLHKTKINKKCKFFNRKSAKLCNLNYSTAKSLIKNISLKEENYIVNELNCLYAEKNKKYNKAYCIVKEIQNKEYKVENFNCNSSSNVRLAT